MRRERKFTLTMPLVGLLTLCLLSPPVGAQYGGGTGGPDDPYLIYTAEQMNAIGANRNDWDKHFKLMADIDLGQYTGKTFNIIGTGENSAFRGVFNGNNKKISRFYSTKRDYTPMSVVLNGSSAVYHDNPNATRIDTWTGLTIDLQAFSSVDLTDVNSIAICFGDQNDPQPGGSGRMFFDDIQLYRLLP